MRKQVGLLAAFVIVVQLALTNQSFATQTPGVEEDQEQFMSVTCGPEGATFEESLPGGKIVKRHERKYASYDEAMRTLQERASAAEYLLSRGPATDKHGEVVGTRVELLAGTKATEIEVRGEWLITVDADSLDELRQYQERRRARRSAGAPPN